MTIPRYTFFIAHASADGAAARALCDLLRPHVPCFLDALDLEPGQAWDAGLREAQAASRATVVLISAPKPDRAHYRDAEIADAIAFWRANEATHRVIPVYLDGRPSDPAHIPFGLTNIQDLDAKALGLAGVADTLRALAPKLTGAARARDGWQIQERPRRPRNLPYDSLGALFKGRDAFVADLHARLQAEPTRAAAIVAKQAIHGLGGVGKTRLAVEYALRHADEYGALLFVAADSPQSLDVNLAALSEHAVLDLSEREAREQDVRVEAVLRWLERMSGWLLILDNVDTPEAAAAVEALLPRLHAGHVLITSRLSAWSAGVDARELDVLDAEAAARFLLERTRDRRRIASDDEAAALRLATTLGGGCTSGL